MARKRKPYQQWKNDQNNREVVSLFFEKGMVPPHDERLEVGVLGAVLLEKEAIYKVIDILKPEMFYKTEHEYVFKAVLQVYDNRNPVDILTVTNQLKAMKVLDSIGGPYYITQLTNTVASSENLEAHSRILSELWIKREIIKICSTKTFDAFEQGADAFELLDSLDKSIGQINGTVVSKDIQPMSKLIEAARAEHKKRKGKEITGVPAGLTDLDKVTRGFQPSDLIILAARPSMGKTALMLTMARNAAEKGKPAAIFSLEMPAVQLINRLMSQGSGVSHFRISNAFTNEYEEGRLNEYIVKLNETPIHIDDSSGLTLRELRTKARKLKQEHDIQEIIVDYLQLMEGEGNSREEEISSISRGLKGLAKELGIPVIALSQLTRQVEKRGTKHARPALSDLRESGAIEQDADMVMFIYRPEYYGITEDANGESLKGVAEIIIGKHRNGELKTVYVKFEGQYMLFRDLEGSKNAEETEDLPF